MGGRLLCVAVAAAMAVMAVGEGTETADCGREDVAKRYPCLCEMNKRTPGTEQLVGGFLPLGMAAAALFLVLRLGGGLGLEAAALSRAEEALLLLLDAVLRSLDPISAPKPYPGSSYLGLAYPFLSQVTLLRRTDTQPVHWKLHARQPQILPPIHHAFFSSIPTPLLN